jgi:hypothetical protein
MSQMSFNVDMADIVAIKVSCGHCGAAAEFPIAHLETDPPERCFHCRGNWFDEHSTSAVAIQHLFQSFVQLRSEDQHRECQVQIVVRPDAGSSRVTAAK